MKEKWTNVMNKGTSRVKSNVRAPEKQFKRIREVLITFTSHCLPVKNGKTTGRLSEEDIISSPVSRYCLLDIYVAISNDREKYRRQGKTAKRKAQLAHYKWVACCRVLRTFDKYSAATNSSRGKMEVDDSSDKEGEGGSTSSTNTANLAYQRHPGGIKAAKQMRS